MQIPAFYVCKSQCGSKCFKLYHRGKHPVMVKVHPSKKPCTISQALYLTMFPCSSHFLLKTQPQAIASLPSGKSSILQVSIFFSIFRDCDWLAKLGIICDHWYTLSMDQTCGYICKFVDICDPNAIFGWHYCSISFNSAPSMTCYQLAQILILAGPRFECDIQIFSAGSG